MQGYSDHQAHPEVQTGQEELTPTDQGSIPYDLRFGQLSNPLPGGVSWASGIAEAGEGCVFRWVSGNGMSIVLKDGEEFVFRCVSGNNGSLY